MGTWYEWLFNPLAPILAAGDVMFTAEMVQECTDLVKFQNFQWLKRFSPNNIGPIPFHQLVSHMTKLELPYVRSAVLVDGCWLKAFQDQEFPNLENMVKEIYDPKNEENMKHHLTELTHKNMDKH